MHLIDIRKPWPARLATLLALTMFVGGFVLHQGRVSFYAGPAGRTLVLTIELFAIILAAGICLAYRHYGVVIWSILLAIYAVSQVYWFSVAWNRDANLSAVSVYFGLLSSVVFVPSIINLGPKKLIQIIFTFAMIYALFYIALSQSFMGLKPPSDPGAEKLFIAADRSIGRPSRFAMLTSLMIFGACISYSRIMAGKNLIYILTLLIFGAGIWLSYFRTTSFVTIFVLILYTIFRTSKLVGIICYMILFMSSTILLVGLNYNSFRPYDLFGHDASATIRAISYEATRYFVPDYWLFGVGLASGREDTVNLMGTTTFFSSDIGTVGVFYTSGLIGVFLFMAISAISALSGFFLQSLGFERADADGLALAGGACALLGVIAPDLWSGSSTILSALFVAALYLHLKYRQREPRFELLIWRWAKSGLQQ